MSAGTWKRKLLVFGAVVAVGSEVFWQLYRFIRWMRTSNAIELDQETLLRDARKPPDLWNTVLFFPDVDPSLPNSSRSQFLAYLKKAKVSMRICIYLASLPEFTTVIRQKWKDGLCIQVITDLDTLVAHNNFCCKDFIRAGIPLRIKDTSHLMHHKFIIIDDEALLTGSLNYTKQAFQGNSENVVVTTEPGIVLSYRKEFSELWKESKEPDLSQLRFR